MMACDVHKIKTISAPFLLFLHYLLALVEALENAIADKLSGNVVDPFEAHRRVQQLYTWQNVATRTEAVYDKIMSVPSRDMSEKIKRYI